jgi:hypothetical protein
MTEICACRPCSESRGLLAAAAVILAVPAGLATVEARQNVNSAAPIRVERCAVDSRTVLVDPFNSIRSNSVTGVSVRLTNERKADATRVTIVLSYAGTSESIAVNGPLAGGRSFDRSFPAFTGDAYGGASANCRVTSAAFGDGTTWNAAR